MHTVRGMEGESTDGSSESVSESVSAPASEPESESASEFAPATATSDIDSQAPRRRARTRATHSSKASVTGNIVKLLQPALCHISQKKIHRYAAGLARACFDTASALKQASVADVVSAGMPKGHALQVEGTRDTTSSSDTSSTCSSSSQFSSGSGSSS